MAKAAKPVPEGFQTITPQLTLDNAAEGIEWYKRALDAKEVSRSLGPDGKVMHGDIVIGNSHFFVNDVMMGMKGPKGFGGSPASFWLYVENSDALFKRAIDAGATEQMPVADQFWGDRAGCIADPAGYSWWISTRKEDLTPAELRQRADEFFKQMAPPAVG
jgi:PhnB protein